MTRYSVKIFSAALLAAFVLVFQVNAQTFDLAIPGARTLGMGGVNTATVNDLSAQFWNPAGLLDIEHFQLTYSSRWIDEGQDLPDGQSSQDNFEGHHASGLIGFAWPFEQVDRRMSVAVGYYRPIELTTRYKNHPVDGGVGAFMASYACQVTPSVKVGLTPAYWTGQRDFNSYVQSYQFVWDTDYSGFNATLGVKADFREMNQPLPLEAGLTIRTPFDLDLTYSDHTAGLGIDSSSAFDFTVEMPWMVALGVVYHYSHDWIFSLDYEARLYGDSKIIETSDLYGKRTYDLSGAEKNLHIIRAGTEYRWRFWKNTYPLRFGIRNVPTLLANRYADNDVSQVDGVAVGLGAGVERSLFRIDVGYEFKHYSKTSAVSTTNGTKEVDSGYSFSTFMFEATFFLGKTWKSAGDKQ